MSTAIDQPAQVDFSKSEAGKSFFAELEGTPTAAPEPTPEPVKEEKSAVEPTKAVSEPVKSEAKETIKEQVKEEPKKEVAPTTKIGRENWDKLKAEKEAIEKRLQELEPKVKDLEPQAAKVAELEKELETLRETAKTAAQYKAMADKAVELEQTLKRVSIKDHPDFKAKYNLPQKRIQENIKEYLGETDQSKAYIEAFNLPLSKFRDERLEAAREDMTLSKQATLVAYETQWKDIQKDMDFELNNAEIAAGIYEEQQQKKVGEQNQLKEAIFNEAEKWARNNLVTYKKVDGQDAFNADIENRVTAAKQLVLGQASPSELAQAALYAVDYPRQAQLIKILSDELTEAKKTIEQFQQSDPGVTQETKSKEKTIDYSDPKSILSDIINDVYAGKM